MIPGSKPLSKRNLCPDGQALMKFQWVLLSFLLIVVNTYPVYMSFPHMTILKPIGNFAVLPLLFLKGYQISAWWCDLTRMTSLLLYSNTFIMKVDIPTSCWLPDACCHLGFQWLLCFAVFYIKVDNSHFSIMLYLSCSWPLIRFV